MTATLHAVSALAPQAIVHEEVDEFALPALIIPDELPSALKTVTFITALLLALTLGLLLMQWAAQAL